MAGLAQWLLGSGVAVTGSEPGTGPVVDRLRSLGARVATGPNPARFSGATRLVVPAPGTPIVHPDCLRAARLGLPRA
ncbi:MAG TPA: UDP-N-acetylmuramate--alanine ligase, partial [Isosphaeraceae bacterium]|nr:UDP-N-acetylmuramate--alanine ligase [Isosphaeraceae bacterium]